MKRKTFSNIIRKLAFIVACFMTLSVMSGLLAACGGGAIVLDKTEHTMYVGDAIKLTATTAKEDEEITWSSSDEDVVTVRRGTVSAKGVGTATVTAKIASGDSASCIISVQDRTVTISATTLTINMDESVTATLTATSSDNGNITWSTSDSSVATVEGGVITALNPGEVTITAARGAAKAECVVTVIMPSRPADWRLLEPMNNAGVVANAGTWYYFADGSSGDCTYTQKPYYGGGEVGVTIDSMTEGGYFYFRYQPTEDKDGNEFVPADKYSVTFKATMSLAGELRFGGPQGFNTATMEAGVEQELTVNAMVGSGEPFSIRPQEFAAPSASAPLTITVKDVVFTKTGSGDGSGIVEELDPVVPITPNVLGTYDLAIKNNSESVAEPNKIHYWADGTYTLSGSPNMTDGTATLSFSQMEIGKYYQLRYQPDMAVGTQYAITFTVKLNRTGSIAFGTGNEFKPVAMEAGVEREFTYLGTVSAGDPFKIEIRKYDASEQDPITLTVSKIGIQEYIPPVQEPDDDTPTGETYDLALAISKADVVSNAGKWYYVMENGDGSTVDTAKYENDTVTLSLSAANSGYYFLRYQPNLAVGTEYTVSFTLSLNRTGTADDRILSLIVESDHYDHRANTAGTAQEITFTDTVRASEPFQIRFKAPNATSTDPVILTISNIVVTPVNA